MVTQQNLIEHTIININYLYLIVIVITLKFIVSSGVILYDVTKIRLLAC